MGADLPYRLAVGVMLFNKEGLVFVAKRIDTTLEAWQMPQGGIDAGEEPLAAARRELEEEIGTGRVALLAESRRWLTYDLPGDLVPTLWGGKYRGQKQKWFAMRFTGSDSDINIATAHPEFCQWQWINMVRLPDIIVPFKRALYQALVEEFKDVARAA
ncbi:MAG: RNA pyrophosphohydrolase [Pseudomonadota bacterium]|nr:RNA pyrophosphohydrolase [Pseudomonadota bacterium]MDE3038427.1 RNA pyrophosphohydrolase [Pseudomonadota bacterium]